MRTVVGQKPTVITPNIYVYEYLLNTYIDKTDISSGIEKINLQIKCYFKDKIDENYQFNWFDNEDVIQNLKIKTAIYTDEAIYNEDLKNIKNIKARNGVQIFDEQLLNYLKTYQNINERALFPNSNGDSDFYFNFLLNKNIAKSNFVSVIIFPYFSSGVNTVYGTPRSDVIIKNSSIPNGYLVEDENNYVVDYLVNDLNVSFEEIPNFKVKNLSLLEAIIKDDSKSIDAIPQNKTVSCNFYGAKSSATSVKGLFYVSVDDLLLKSSPLYSYFKNNSSKEFIDLIHQLSVMDRVSVLRKRIISNTDLKDQQIEQTIFTLKYGLTDTANTITTQFGKLSEIRNLYYGANDSKYKFFSFVDSDISQINQGEYVYGIEVSIRDGSKALLNRTANDLRVSYGFFKDFFESAKKNINSVGEREGFKDVFINSFININSNIKNIAATIANASIMFNKSLTYNDVYLLISSMIHPLTTNIENLEKILLLIEKLINKIENYAKIDELRSNQNHNTQNLSLTNSAQKPSIAFKQWFNNFIQDASYEKGLGFEYVSALQLPDRVNNDFNNSSILTITETEYANRIQKEILKYFINANSDINQKITVNNKVNPILSSKTIKNYSYSYLSPAFLDVQDQSYDFINFQYDQTQLIHKQADLQLKNYDNFNAKAAPDYLASSFYDLVNKGILVNTVNTITKKSDDKSSVSIMYDDSKDSSQTSKQDLSFMQFDKLDLSIEANSTGIKKFFDAYDVTSAGYFLNIFNDVSSSSEMIDKMPLQLKSVIYKQYQETSNQVSLNVINQKNNRNLYPRIKFDYFFLKQVEFLTQTNSFSAAEKWDILTLSSLQAAKASGASYLLCRLTDYYDKNTSINLQNYVNIPNYNTYFMIKLDNPSLPAPIIERQINTQFAELDYRPEFIKTKVLLTQPANASVSRAGTLQVDSQISRVIFNDDGTRTITNADLGASDEEQVKYLTNLI